MSSNLSQTSISIKFAISILSISHYRSHNYYRIVIIVCIASQKTYLSSYKIGSFVTSIGRTCQQFYNLHCFNKTYKVFLFFWSKSIHFDIYENYFLDVILQLNQSFFPSKILTSTKLRISNQLWFIHRLPPDHPSMCLWCCFFRVISSANQLYNYLKYGRRIPAELGLAKRSRRVYESG